MGKPSTHPTQPLAYSSSFKPPRSPLPSYHPPTHPPYRESDKLSNVIVDDGPGSTAMHIELVLKASRKIEVTPPTHLPTHPPTPYVPKCFLPSHPPTPL